MIRNTMRLAMMLVVLPLLAACDGGAGTNGEGAEADAAASAVETAETIQLAPINRSGVTGTVEADRSPDALRLTLNVEGLEPGATYAAHVHDGRCAAGGPVRAPLGDLTADQQNRSQLEREVAAVPAPEPVFVQVHAPDGSAVACGDLPTGEETTLRTDVNDSVPPVEPQ